MPIGKRGRADLACFQGRHPIGRLEVFVRGVLDNHHRARRQPGVLSQRRKRGKDETFAVGRVEKEEIAGCWRRGR
jgi:hypothetical protein